MGELETANGNEERVATSGTNQVDEDAEPIPFNFKKAKESGQLKDSIKRKSDKTAGFASLIANHKNNNFMKEENK